MLRLIKADMGITTNWFVVGCRPYGLQRRRRYMPKWELQHEILERRRWSHFVDPCTNAQLAHKLSRVPSDGDRIYQWDSAALQNNKLDPEILHKITKIIQLKVQVRKIESMKCGTEEHPSNHQREDQEECPSPMR